MKHKECSILRLIVIWALIVMVAIIVHRNGWAATYYCSPTGNWTTGNGLTAETAWGTLGGTTVANLESKLSAGDTVLCTNGYHGAINWSGFSEGGLVTFKAENTGLATLSSLYLNTGNYYIKFEGFLVHPGADGVYGAAPGYSGVIEVENGSNRITFDSVTAYCVAAIDDPEVDWTDSLFYATLFLKGDSISVVDCIIKNGIYCMLAASCDSLWVKNSELTGFGDDVMKIWSNTTIEDCDLGDGYSINEAYHNDLIQIFGGGGVMNRNVIIRRNLIYSVSYGRTEMIPDVAQGIFTDEGAWNITIENNAIFTRGVPHGITLANATNARIVNNTVVNIDPGVTPIPGIYVFSLEGGTRNVITPDSIFVYNNMSPVVDVEDNAHGAVSNNWTGYNMTQQDAALTSRIELNAYPKSTASTLINEGVENVMIPNNDIRRIYVRPDSLQAPTFENDIGAYEYGASLASGEEEEEEPEPPVDPTSVYATGTGAGTEDGTSWDNALAFADIGTVVDAGDTVKCQTADLATMLFPADSLTYLVYDTITIDGRSAALTGFTDNITGGGGSGADTVYVAANGDDGNLQGGTFYNDDGGALYVGWGGANWNAFFTFDLSASALGGVTPDSARVTFYGVANDASISLRIAAHDSAYSPNPTNASTFNIMAAKLTTADDTVTYNTTGANSAHSYLITDIAAEVFAIDGWDEKLQVVVLGTGSGDYARIASYENATLNPARLAVYYPTGGEADTLLSWKALTYEPYRVWINGVAASKVDYGDVDTGAEYAFANDTLYVRYEDKAAVSITGEYAFNADGNSDIVVKALTGALVAKNFNNLSTTGIKFERVIADSIGLVEADSLYRATVANSDSFTSTHSLNALASAVTGVSDTTGTDTYRTASALETDYTLDGLETLAENGERWGAVDYTLPEPEPDIDVILTVLVDSLKVGKTSNVSAEADSNGIGVYPVTITSSDTDIATVVAGVLTAVSAGEVQIIASYYSAASDTETVIVYAPTVTSIVISPTTNTLQVGSDRQYTATVYDEDSEVMAAYADSVVWDSTDDDTLTVSATGLVEGVGAGVATISAAIGEVNDTLEITVTALPIVIGSITITPATQYMEVGDEVAYTVSVKDTAGDNVPDSTAIAVRVLSDSTIAEIDAADTLTATDVGTLQIRVTFGAFADTAFVTIAHKPTSVQITGVSNDSLKIGKTDTGITGTLLDENGDPMDSTVVMAVSDEDIATLVAGTLTAIATGEVIISATFGVIVAYDTVTVYAPTLTSIVISPTTATLAVGATRQYSATVYDEDVEAMPDYQDSLVWDSTDDDTLTVSETGLATGIGAGVASISAAVGEVSDTLEITVSAVTATPGKAFDTVDPFDNITPFDNRRPFNNISPF